MLLLANTKQKQEYYSKQVKMKMQLKSVLKSNFTKLRCLDESQVVYVTGNSLCITQIGKSQSEFIHLHKQNSYVYDFAVSPNSRQLFTAENIDNGIEISMYTASNERKYFRLTDLSNYMPLDVVENVQLLTDEYESTIVYVVTKNKNDACVTLIDMLRQRVISHGFLSDFNEIITCSEETYQISLCGKGYVRRLKAVDSTWMVQQKLPKKLQNYEIFHHRWMALGRCLIMTKTTGFLVEDNDIVQTLTLATQQQPIKQVIKVNKGFIVVSDKGKIKLFYEEGQECFYNQVQQIQLPLNKMGKISQIQFNARSEEIFVLFASGKVYHSKVEEASAVGKQTYFNFEQINLNYFDSTTGSVTTTPSKNYCLISSQKSAELWDLGKLVTTLTLQAHNLGQQKVIRCSAMSPDGNSICIGYSDRVRFYRILLNKFKQYAQYSIKSAVLLHYSHGGQLVAMTHGKGINTTLSIINTLNLKQVMSFKLGYKAAQAIWSEHDDELFISGQDTKVISVYQISTKSRKSFLQFDKPITYIRFDYLTNKLLVSTDSQVHLINYEHKTQSIVKPKVPHFNYVFPAEGAYFATDKKGGLYFSASIQFEKYQYIRLFNNENTHLLYKKNQLIVYTSPSEVLLLKIKFGSNEPNQNQMHQNVVLVQKEQINKFFDKVKLLQGQLDQLQTSTSVKLQEQKKLYFQDLEKKEYKFKGQIQFLQKKLNDLTAEKNRQEKNNMKVFEDLETGQIKSVNDLERIFDTKIKLQKEKYLALQQQNLQQKMKYQNIIKGLQQKHNSEISKIRKQYSQKIQKQLKSMQSQKDRHMQQKKKAEFKLIDMQEEGQLTLFEMQMQKNQQIKDLSERYVKLERQFDSRNIFLHNMEEEMSELMDKYNQTKQKITKSQMTIQENLNKIKMLERQIEKKNSLIEQRNSTIEQQAHQIDGLEKAKYVLSFRTTQVRKQLEPKETLIDKMKNEMFKLDEEYKNQVKNSFQLNQKLEKLDKIVANLKQQNTDIKAQLKSKERVHNDLCSEIYYLVNGADQKQWNPSLIRLYQQYINEDKVKHKSKKNDDSTCEQINRHLIHVEQSLHQVATGNEKMLKGKQQEVVRKMKENAELVYDLNIMRKEQNKLRNDIKQKNTEISRLKRELNQSLAPKSTRANTANTGITRRLVSKDGINQNTNSDWIDLSIKRKSDYLLPDKSKKNRVFSAHRTMMWRDDGRKQKSKISDIARELESAKNTILRQDRMIEELNQRLLGLPDDQFT